MSLGSNLMHSRDKNGNSVRAVDFFHRLCDRFSLHVYDSVCDPDDESNEVAEPVESHVDDKERISIRKNPRVKHRDHIEQNVTKLLFAAAAGDVFGIRRLLSSGIDVKLTDYDERTALVSIHDDKIYTVAI